MAAVASIQRWSVQGMTCQSCVRSIETVLQDVEGIQSVSVSLDENSATVVYDAQTVGAQEITAAIEGCGFDAQTVANSLQKQATLAVHGMTCQSCVKSVKAALGGVAGIEAADVSLEDSAATVTWSPHTVGGGVAAIVKIIEEAGFDARAPEAESAEKPSEVVAVAVGGMTCHSCVASVTMALKDTPGVVDAKVELEPSGRALVTIDSSAADAAAVVAAIEDAGFDATLELDGSAASAFAASAFAASASASGGTLPATLDVATETPAPDAVVLAPLLQSGKPERKVRARGISTGSGPMRSSSSGKSGETLLDPGETIQIEVRGMT
ncbi:Cu(2+)-transporting P-type ATPase, partial [Coemansia erecta]